MFTSDAASFRAEYIKTLHKEIKERIEKKNQNLVTRKNQGRKELIFKPGDWVWVHLRKERFPDQRKSKLQQRGDGPFQVLEWINNNAYKLDLRGNEDLDLRKNPSKEREDDVDSINNLLHVPERPITKRKAKKIQEDLGETIIDSKFDLRVIHPLTKLLVGIIRPTTHADALCLALDLSLHERADPSKAADRGLALGQKRKVESQPDVTPQ
ncbi:hypothetical protein E5676_scaffold371G00020 [Cucumis melo var. makuwa]|uniref:Tf2-1-like SH3-like domain-containing protein n=1 Tax=Cucumis melo var. makuwa TaxID=1194695 RepID=A0A5D3BD91_CUCMM|nr:hypothetical protein E5676_scaffold371G00020 [Cucumis melo var. makuwa]